MGATLSGYYELWRSLKKRNKKLLTKTEFTLKFFLFFFCLETPFGFWSLVRIEKHMEVT